MGWLFTSQHEKICAAKQKEREDRIKALPEYHKSLTTKEKSIIDTTVPELVKLVKSNELKPKEILLAFGKQTLVAQARTNCLTEVMIKDAESWAENANLKGPLAGIPMSLKDHILVKGYDATVGYSSCAFKPREDGETAELVRRTGAVPYVKTNVPITMMAIDGYNDMFGRTANWHNPKYAPGGSSQGEASLIAGGGSRIGIGSDIGGSVRVPAAFSGICSLKFSTRRWPMDGDLNVAGYEAVEPTTSPMAKTLPDLRYFIESIIGMEPWKTDYGLIPLPWRDVEFPAKPKVGVLTFPDYLPPSPAQKRALDTAADALKKQGCEVVPFDLPSPPLDYENVLQRLYCADGYKHFTGLLSPGEHNDPYVAHAMKFSSLPNFVRKIWQGILWLFGCEKYKYLDYERESTSGEFIDDTGRREALRKQFSKKWDALDVDFLICPPYPTPALPALVPDSFRTILYTSLFNLLDYPAGILPIGRVNSKLDKLPGSFDFKKLSYPAKIAYNHYDPVAMEGLPISVQVVTKRYQDEKALKALEYTFDALKKAGVTYTY